MRKIILLVGIFLAGCTVIPTPVGPIPYQTITGLPTPTKMPTPTPTENAEPTKTAAEETSRYFQPEFQLDLEGTVDGVTIPFTFGLHKSIVERAEEPIKTISVNREDAPELYAKFWLTMCWQKYVQQNPDQAGISFTDYEELVKKGEGEIQVAAVDESTDDQNNKILTYHPEKGFVQVLVDSTVSLPEEANTLSSFYFGMNDRGQMAVISSFNSFEIADARKLDGWNSWNGNTLVDVHVSSMVAANMELIISTENDALISQKPYWRVAGQVTLPDIDLYLNPIIRNTQYTDRSALLTIQK